MNNKRTALGGNRTNNFVNIHRKHKNLNRWIFGHVSRQELTFKKKRNMSEQENENWQANNRKCEDLQTHKLAIKKKRRKKLSPAIATVDFFPKGNILQKSYCILIYVGGCTYSKQVYEMSNQVITTFYDRFHFCISGNQEQCEKWIEGTIFAPPFKATWKHYLTRFQVEHWLIR